MKIKLLALAISTTFIVGCASTQTLKKEALSPNDDSLKPTPISTVFHRPEGAMVISYTKDGKFLEITTKGMAPIAGNNAYSIEQAAQVAQLRAKRSIAEFISTQLTTTRSVKVLSTTVQKSLENTSSGQNASVVVDDKDFDADGNPIINAANVDTNKPINYKDPNTNSEKVAQIVRENITTNASALLKGVVISSEHIDQQSRTIVVEVKTGTATIGAADELRRLMGSKQ